MPDNHGPVRGPIAGMTWYDEPAKVPPLTIAAMTAEIREVVIAKGFRPAEGGPDTNTFGDYIALAHSELSEALEAYRDHRLADATKYGTCAFGSCDNHPHKPEGVGSELADVLIRLLDMADVFGIDMEFEYRRKIAYNRTRVWQHGGRTLADTVPPIKALGPVLREDYDLTRKMLDDIRARARAAIVDVIDQHGMGSPEHLRIRYLLSGEGEGESTPEAVARVAEHEKSDPELSVPPIRHIADELVAAMPTDPRGWWTGEEIDEFLDVWARLGLPEIVMTNGQDERVMLWAADLRRVGEWLGEIYSGRDPDGEKCYELRRGEYVACIVQA